MATVEIEVEALRQFVHATSATALVSARDRALEALAKHDDEMRLAEVYSQEQATAAETPERLTFAAFYLKRTGRELGQPIDRFHGETLAAIHFQFACLEAEYRLDIAECGQ